MFAFLSESKKLNTFRYPHTAYTQCIFKCITICAIPWINFVLFTSGRILNWYQPAKLSERFLNCLFVCFVATVKIVNTACNLTNRTVCYCHCDCGRDCDCVNFRTFVLLKLNVIIILEKKNWEKTPNDKRTERNRTEQNESIGVFDFRFFVLWFKP